VLGVPARVVADHRDEGRSGAQRGVELKEVEAGGAVPQHRHHRRLGRGQSRAHGEGQGGADGPGETVDDPLRSAHAGLRPLPEFASVGNQHRLALMVQQVLHRPAHLHRVQPRARRACGRLPVLRAVVHRGAHLLRPAAVPWLGPQRLGERESGQRGIGQQGAPQAFAERAVAAPDRAPVRVHLGEATA
jgi:hypothetical protein